MGIRVGESWRASNGHRRWVSMPLHDVLALGLLGAWLVLPVWFCWKLTVWSLWLAAEFALFLFTGVLAVIALARREARPSDVTLSRLRWGLFMVNLKGRP